ncbi:MAG: methylated-DNA--[protein]-cysteine S-methyltransferase [Thermoplasmata archaeon]|nr:methylated-DNA--[protein]-cysteine S-methyltransferase [Thermoplasmata archaeon]
MDEGDECITSGDWRVHTEGIAHLSRAVSIFDSPTGPIRVTMAGDVLVRLELEPENPGEGEPPPRVARELKEYFSGERKAFDIPYNMEGTPFQLAVWDALAQIPYGETRTYGEVAKSIGKPGAMRAVGTAAGKNHLPIIIPCHRVVAANGMGGFSAGLWRKDWLLTLEGRRG